MPLLNFELQFAPAVEARLKLHTIRADRKWPIKVGDTLYLYTGLRTRRARRLLVARCTRVQRVRITARGAIFVDAQRLSLADKQRLARNDGFADTHAMLRWFRKHLPFRGQLIHWQPNEDTSS